MKKINMFKNYFIATTGLVLFASSFAHAQQTSGKGATQLAPTSGGTQAVKVVNTSAEPVPVRDVDSAGRQPFRYQLSIAFNDGSTFASSPAIVMDPGKRLVVKYATAHVNLPPGQVGNGGFHLPGTVSGGEVIYDFTLTKQGTFGPSDLFTSSQPMELYLDPGNSFSFVFERSGTTGVGGVSITISGYFVNVP